MIFVTVGTQLPFDRMIRAIDEWAGQHGRGAEVFAQIGPSSFKPKHVAFAPFIAADEFQRRTLAARVIVAHAGMGSIITALEQGKPILVMPRRAALGEQRNDHQMATARHFQQQGRITVAFDEAELLARLTRVDELAAGTRIAHAASPRLLGALRRFAGGVPANGAAAAADSRDERAFRHTDYAPEHGFEAATAATAAAAAGSAAAVGSPRGA